MGAINKPASYYELWAHPIDCANCGVTFVVTAAYDQRRRDKGDRFYCPNGHYLSYHETKEDRLQRQLDSANKHAEHMRVQRNKEAASKRAIRGHMTRLKNRVAAGVCPCCNRTFSNLARHMKGQHPDYQKQDIG